MPVSATKKSALPHVARLNPHSFTMVALYTRGDAKVLSRKREKAAAFVAGEVDAFDVEPGDAGRVIARDPECFRYAALEDATACFARERGDNPQMMTTRARSRCGVTMMKQGVGTLGAMLTPPC